MRPSRRVRLRAFKILGSALTFVFSCYIIMILSSTTHKVILPLVNGQNRSKYAMTKS